MIEGEKILYKLFKFIENKKIYNEGVQSTLLLTKTRIIKEKITNYLNENSYNRQIKNN